MEKLPENFIVDENTNWDFVSYYYELSEQFIEKNIDKLNLSYISAYQKLSENFIEKYIDKLDLSCIVYCQKLSDKFIEKYFDKLDLFYVIICQILSEDFIEKHIDKLNLYNISYYQKLSENFIEKHIDKLDMGYVSKFQKLSENFIEKYIDKLDLSIISAYQNLSEDFKTRHNIVISENCWLYKTDNFKIDYIKKNTDYEVIDNKYIIAYKSVKDNYESVFKKNYFYRVNEIFESHCDCNYDNNDSFGLSAWNKEKALEYYNKGKLLKVKINIKDIGVITKLGKIRCRKLLVLEEVEK